MIEEFKYGLRDEQYMNIHSLIKIMNSLNEINYCDYEIMLLMMKRIEKILHVPEDNRIKFEERHYQIEKKGYYGKNIVNQKHVLKN